MFILDVKGDFNFVEIGKDVGVLESLKVDSYYLKLIFVVFNLFGEEDEKFLVIVFIDKRLVFVEEGIEKVLRFVLLYIKFLFYFLMNEIIVEVWMLGEVWKLFGKKFVEYYKN